MKIDRLVHMFCLGSSRKECLLVLEMVGKGGISFFFAFYPRNWGP